MIRFVTPLIAGSALLAATTIAGAAPVIFFGEDLATGRTVPAGGNAANARASFLGNLSGGVGTETFESFDPASLPPYAISFPGSTGSITGTLTHASGICSELVNCTAPASGEFATSGTHWVFTNESLNIAFSDPVAAFGFFGTDVGDLGARLTITLTRSGGGDLVVDVPNTLGSANSNGDLLFWGFIDPAATYSSIQFGLNGGSGDFFGFDDMTIGDLAQVELAPAPSSLALALIGLAALARRLPNSSRATAAYRSIPVDPAGTS